MPCIYKITNAINGKVYIGQTKRKLVTRWNQHKAAICSSLDFPLYRAFRKHGIENFQIECIRECTCEELNELEKHWIAFYNAYEKGYNGNRGGNGTEYSTLRDISHSQEKKVKQYTLNGEFVCEYESIHKAARDNNVDVNRIIACCKHRQQQSVGYQWCYIGEEDTIKCNLKLRIEYPPQPIVAFIDGSVLHFRSLKSAAKSLHGSKEKIKKCCTTLKNQTYKGYYWRYEEEYNT
jgi:hypothetical protein